MHHSSLLPLSWDKSSCSVRSRRVPPADEGCGQPVPSVASFPLPAHHFSLHKHFCNSAHLHTTLDTVQSTPISLHRRLLELVVCAPVSPPPSLLKPLLRLCLDTSQNCSFVQVTRGLSGVKCRLPSVFIITGSVLPSFESSALFPRCPGPLGCLAPPPSSPASRAAPSCVSSACYSSSSHPLSAGMVLSALVSVVSSSVSCSGGIWVPPSLRLRPGSPRHPPSRLCTSASCPGPSLCSDLGPEPPSDGPLTPSLAGVCCYPASH